jgi:hypothetical protein
MVWVAIDLLSAISHVSGQTRIGPTGAMGAIASGVRGRSGRD